MTEQKALAPEYWWVESDGLASHSVVPARHPPYKPKFYVVNPRAGMKSGEKVFVVARTGKKGIHIAGPAFPTVHEKWPAKLVPRYSAAWELATSKEYNYPAPVSFLTFNTEDGQVNVFNPGLTLISPEEAAALKKTTRKAGLRVIKMTIGELEEHIQVELKKPDSSLSIRVMMDILKLDIFYSQNPDKAMEEIGKFIEGFEEQKKANLAAETAKKIIYKKE